MKKIILKVLFIALLLFLILSLIYLGTYRFWHPQLTETQLFFALWWKVLLLIPLGWAVWLIMEEID